MGWSLRAASVACAAAAALAAAVSGPMSPAAARPAGAASPRTPSLEFDLPRGVEEGLLVPGQAFTLSLRLTDWTAARGDEVAAIFESPAFPRRLVPLAADGASAGLGATVVFEPRPFAPGGEQALRIEVAIARLRGMRIEPVLKRTLYLTYGSPPPSPAEPAAPPSAPSAGDPAPTAASPPLPPPDGALPADRPVLPVEEVREEDLGGGAPAAQSPLYWRTVRELLSRRWQVQLGQLGKGQGARGLRVRFRLYAGGLAQLIQVERSSGDARVDEAGLRAVLTSLPFPPFPTEVREPSVELHVDLPGARR